LNHRAVAWLLGRVVLFLAAFQLVPAAVAWYFGEHDDLRWFLMSAGFSALVGLALAWRPREGTIVVDNRATFFRREGLAVVGLSWLTAAALGAVPFLLSGAIPSPVDAFFESASGFTTTGSTILDSAAIDGLSKSVSFWRCFTHWLGGIGIVLVFVVFFPTGGRSLFRSEVPGIARDASHHRVRDSAMGLMRVYVGLTALLIVVLTVGGMGLYDAAVHAFSTIATGGFSTHGQSMAFFGSWVLELLVVAFMFLAGINFALYDLALRRGWREAWRAVAQSSEIRAYAGTAVGVTAVITGVLWFWGGSNGVAADDPALVSLPDYSHLSLCLRDSLFAVVSVQTSTGFATADFDRWPELCRGLLMLVAVVGACAGSTGGGIKVVRILILAQAAVRGVQAFARPRALHHTRIDGHTLDEGTVAAVTGYCGLWALVFALGTLALTALDLDLLSAATAVIATLNNIGPGLGAVGPWLNFGELPVLAKLLLSIFMILGRLEFYALVVLLMPRFWRS
jgi:trk system potassium uptake protein TrkH